MARTEETEAQTEQKNALVVSDPRVLSYMVGQATEMQMGLEAQREMPLLKLMLGADKVTDEFDHENTAANRAIFNFLGSCEPEFAAKLLDGKSSSITFRDDTASIHRATALAFINEVGLDPAPVMRALVQRYREKDADVMAAVKRDEALLALRRAGLIEYYVFLRRNNDRKAGAVVVAELEAPFLQQELLEMLPSTALRIAANLVGNHAFLEPRRLSERVLDRFSGGFAWLMPDEEFIVELLHNLITDYVLGLDSDGKHDILYLHHWLFEPPKHAEKQKATDYAAPYFRALNEKYKGWGASNPLSLFVGHVMKVLEECNLTSADRVMGEDAVEFYRQVAPLSYADALEMTES